MGNAILLRFAKLNEFYDTITDWFANLKRKFTFQCWQTRLWQDQMVPVIDSNVDLWWVANPPTPP